MAYYIRKISPAKWPKKGEAIKADGVRADAITGDIRTIEDTISLWRIEDIDELEQAVLALASAGDKAVTYNVLSIPEELIEKYNLELKETDGNTPVKELAKTHRDVVNVTYSSLGSFAQVIIEALNADKLHTVTKKKVKNLIMTVYKVGKIDKDILKDRMREEIEVALQKGA